MLLTDHALAQQLEAVEAHLAAEYAATHARLFPANGAAQESIAGGVAVFAGAESPLTQAVGLGMNGPVDEAEVERLEDFYRRHNAPVNIEFCPHADDGLRQALARRGYTLIEQTNLLVQELSAQHALSTPPAGVIVRQAQPSEFEDLAQVVARGFMPDDELAPEMVAIFAVFCHMPTAAAFLAEVDGRLAGGGMALARDGVMALFATATLPELRGRGAQSALIAARLALGIEADCRLATVGAVPGTTSHRNLERQGFRVAYTRAKLFRAL